MSNIGRIKELADSLFLTNISKGRIDLTEYSEENLLFLELILEREVDIRRNNKIKINLSRSGITGELTSKTLDSFNLSFTKNITKWLIEKLKDVSFIKRRNNVLITGGVGTGKTHLALGCALNAIKNGVKSFYTTVSNLLNIIKSKDISKIYKQKYEYIKSCDLVVIDEFGYIPLTQDDVLILYELINTINSYASLIIITNREFDSWKTIFYDEIIASTLLDRIIENALVIRIDAESYRLKATIDCSNEEV